MHLLICLGSYQATLYLAFLYVSLYLIMYYQQLKWFLINLPVLYALLLNVIIDIMLCFYYVFNQPG